jgi:ATP phosphoribosyltransferase regulatory subunit
MGFSFDVEAIRELIGTEASAPERPAATLVAYGTEGQLGEALDLLEALHRDGARAELLQSSCASRADAEAVAAERGCAACHWIGS